MNVFEQLREMKVSSEYEAAKKLHKFTKVFLAAEDLVLAVSELELPANLFMEK